MYEFSLTHSVNDAVQKLCRDAGWSRVRRIMLKVGGLRQINPELMAFIFAAVSKGTPSEGAIFSVMMLPVTVRCTSCKRTGVRDDTEFLCPYCGSRNVELVSGNEFGIDLEVESNLFSRE